MAQCITPSLGCDLDLNSTTTYWDGANSVPSPQLGVSVRGVDGHLYKWVKASAAIAGAASPGTAIAITEPANTAATGAGGFNAPVAGVAINAYFWARKLAL